MHFNYLPPGLAPALLVSWQGINSLTTKNASHAAKEITC